LRRPWLIAAILLVATWGAYRSWLLRPVDRGAGVLAADEPRHSELQAPLSFRRGDYELSALATYRLRVRLLSRRVYRFDRVADLSPIDFAIGWGPMSDSTLLDRLDIDQSVRYFTLHWDDPTLPEKQILDHAANMHLIPADSTIERSLARMRPGEIIELEGYLVSAKAADGWTWRSSLTRGDRGAGACELMWVERARSS
jgi:hypothetical protein